MTNYHLKPPQTLPSLAWQEAKEKRKQVLASGDPEYGRFITAFGKWPTRLREWGNVSNCMNL